MFPQPSAMYFELIQVLKSHLKIRYPGKVVSIEENDDGTPTGVCVFGIGEHGVVRFALDYENYNLSNTNPKLRED